MKLIKILQGGNEYKKIKADFQKIGIRIYRMKSLEVEIWKLIYVSISELINLYPIVNNGSLAWIRVENEDYFESVMLKKDTLASSGFFISKYLKSYVDMKKRLGIVFNKSAFKSIGNDEEVRSKKVDKETFIKIIVAHEFGHILDLILSEYNFSESHGLQTYKTINERYKKQKSDIIIEKAFNKYFKENEWDIRTVISQLGEYASKNRDEMFAEAIAIHYCNMDTDLSLIIIEELNKLLKDG